MKFLWITYIIQNKEIEIHFCPYYKPSKKLPLSPSWKTTYWHIWRSNLKSRNRIPFVSSMFQNILWDRREGIAIEKYLIVKGLVKIYKVNPSTSNDKPCLRDKNKNFFNHTSVVESKSIQTSSNISINIKGITLFGQDNTSRRNDNPRNKFTHLGEPYEFDLQKTYSS